MEGGADISLGPGTLTIDRSAGDPKQESTASHEPDLRGEQARFADEALRAIVGCNLIALACNTASAIAVGGHGAFPKADRTARHRHIRHTGRRTQPGLRD